MQPVHMQAKHITIYNISTYVMRMSVLFEQQEGLELFS